MRNNRKVSIVFAIILALTINTNIAFANGSETKFLTPQFVEKAEYSLEKDSSGKTVIILTDVEPLNSRANSDTNHFSKTSVAILPSSEKETAKIIENIKTLRRGSGSYTEDDWFYGSSVYLKSTVNYFTEVGSDGLTYGGITNVTISSSTNSGTSISSMTLSMGQLGWREGGGYANQQTSFNAITARSFSAPSSWGYVLWDGSGDVGANLECTAERQGGQSTFTLYNSVQ